MFISDHKRGVELYEANQKKFSNTTRMRRMKRVTTTRWSSHSVALGVMLVTYEAVLKALEEVQEFVTARQAATAAGLLAYFKSEKFFYARTPSKLFLGS